MPGDPILPPTLQDIELLAREALETIPEPLRRNIVGVVLRVEDFPDEAVETEMGLDSPYDLLGLYRGVALPDKSVGTVVLAPDMIFLYRRPILDFWCESGEELYDVVRHVMIHEIGHHFGFTDADMERLEQDDA